MNKLQTTQPCWMIKPLVLLFNRIPSAAKLFVLVCALSVCCATDIYAQKNNVSIVAKNQTVEKVLKEIKQKTGYNFFYNNKLVNVNRRVSVSAKNGNVFDVLKTIFKGTNVSYSVMDDSIILSVNDEKAEKAAPSQTKGKTKVTGVVKDENGEPMIGVSVKGSDKSGAITDIDGNFSINAYEGEALSFSYLGYTPKKVVVGKDKTINIVLNENATELTGVVITALGIQRKESSLTYATQQLKSDDLTKVQDPNVANSIEGKVSGVTITASAGGAGGASKIILRGNKSILGNSTPLIVIDGVPMTNSTRGQMSDGANINYSSSSEGGDALSMVNPDDIASINVLKGANAAALYGSVAANGVLMITTKKGREGVMSVNFSSNITIDNPLLTPKIQNTYGAAVDATGKLGISSWGDKLASRSADNLIINVPKDETKFGTGTREVHLRNSAGNDLDDFYRTGATTNNSISLSGGTEKMKTYFSYSNSYSNGMLKNNSYNRNTFALRQSFEFYKRFHIDVSMNYVNTVTRNRPGGGTVMNPIYHMYTMPRNVDIGYYSSHYATTGNWNSEEQSYYKRTGASYNLVRERVALSGTMQDWAYQESMQNNPYWLMNQNNSKQNEDRFYGVVTGRVDIYDGLSFQARVSIDHDKYTGDSRRYATTFLPAGMDDYGHYWRDISKTDEIYTDYMLNYNKEFGDYSVSANAGWIGHTIKGQLQKTDVVATYIYPMKNKLSDRINLFMTNAGGTGATTLTNSSNWDKGAFVTAQVGWKDKIYVDGSYRRDWYRAYKQWTGVDDNYGYFGFGANAIVSSLVKLPSWISYMKYRASYSEVGNSIPNQVYSSVSENLETGSITISAFGKFKNPKVETSKSFETGLEMMFLNNRLSFDLTYYNATMHDLYMSATNAAGKTLPMNSGRVRNQGVEATVGYDFKLGKNMSWKSIYNISYNDNKILETANNSDGSEMLIYQDVSGVRVRYNKGGSIGDMYVTDFKRDDKGNYVLDSSGRTQLETESDKKFTKYVGNMNSKWQMGWSNTFKYKDFSLFFLINGRIGGKVVSLTEATLDKLGLSQRTADARLYAEANNIVASDYGNAAGMVLPDGSGRIVPIQSYYESIGGTPNMTQYIYSGTNFRLRELSLGYTFRNLMGQNKHLTLSFIARNLFFLYKDSPTDPDVSLSTSNGLGAFESFNMPSSRSFGFALNLNL
jgi:TonB-linked SusC/RagA family outer membrane protein